MKKIVLSTFFSLLSITAISQVIIGKETTNGSSSILEFYDSSDNFKGIIIPAVDNITKALAVNSQENNGTFLFDKSDEKLKMYEDNTWVELSGVGNKTSLINNTTDEVGKGVIIGSENTSSIGVLVLESSNKAIILPKISNPHTTVKSPYPGMMCYDTAGKVLAIFDGKMWNYWK